jgi:hypothetical protein
VTRPVHPEGVYTQGLRFDIRCPDCGGVLQWLASSVLHPLRTTAVVYCETCHDKHVVVVAFVGPYGKARTALKPGGSRYARHNAGHRHPIQH